MPAGDLRACGRLGRRPPRRRADLHPHPPGARPRGAWPLVTYVSDVRTGVTEAKEAAGDKNVLVHGAGTAQRALAAGVSTRSRSTSSRCSSAGAPTVRATSGRSHRAGATRLLEGEAASPTCATGSSAEVEGALDQGVGLGQRRPDHRMAPTSASVSNVSEVEASPTATPQTARRTAPSLPLQVRKSPAAAREHHRCSATCAGHPSG